MTSSGHYQKNLKQLTNKTFSKKYISQYITPVITNINTSKNNKFIIAGSQGAGKSTLTKIFKLALEKIYKKKVMLLSIDDYYLSKKNRLELSKKIHPLLITRGVPGTHNIEVLKKDVISFQKKKFPIITPTFNKLKDDISNKKKIIKNADKLILFPIYTAGEKLKLGFSYIKFAREIIKNSRVQLFLVDDKFQLAKFIKANIYGKKIVIGMGAGTISSWMRELPKLLS